MATIINPKTNRTISVRVWKILPRQVLEQCQAGWTVKDISWSLLSDEETIRDVTATWDDEEETNLSLRIFEQALDWGLGIAVIKFIKSFRQANPGKFPAPFWLCVSRKGEIFAKLNSGLVIHLLD